VQLRILERIDQVNVWRLTTTAASDHDCE